MAGSRLPGEENGSPEGSEAWKGQMLGGHCAPGPLAGLLGPRCEQEWEWDTEFQASGGLEVPFHVFCKTDS